MSRLYSNASKFTYRLDKFRGVNESPDGDTNIKNGEAAVMRNYRITDEGSLKVRPSFKRSIQYQNIDRNVTGIYSGTAKGHKILICPIEGYSFSVMQIDNVMTNVTGITDPDTRLFFFRDELYALSGNKYLKWNGETDEHAAFVEIEGYVPTVIVSAEPSGSGTLYEQVNKLTTSRKVRYNADGTATKYYIPEAGFVSVLSVNVDGVELTPTTDYTVTQGNVFGVHAYVNFTAAPQAGGDNVQVQYSINEEQQYRSNVAETARGSFKFAADGTEVTAITQVRGLNAAGTSWVTMVETTDYTIDGNVMTLVAPTNWTVISMQFRIGNQRDEVVGMRYAETYNGAQDTRIFLYGDGSNTAIYSGIDENGKPTAEYFPDLNEMEIGDSATPITAMIRHRNRLLVFKPHEAYSVYYNPVTLADNTLIAGFYVSNINRDIGCSVMGGAVQVENRIRTVDYNAVWEWKSTGTSGNITSDARNAERVSDRVKDTIATMDLSKAVMLYDIYRHEFYLADGSGIAVVQNTEADAWYVYDNMAATAFAMIDDFVYFGNHKASIYHLDDRYYTDSGNTVTGDDVALNIDAKWESGSLDYGRANIVKYSPTVWVSAVCAEGSEITAAISTDNGETASADLKFAEADGFTRTRKARLKARRFTYHKLKLGQNEDTAHAVIVAVTVDAQYDIPVKR